MTKFQPKSETSGYLEFLQDHPELSYAQAASELGISRQRVYQICHKYQIEHIKTPKVPVRLASERTGRFIYIIGETDNGPFKIGRAWYVDDRLKALALGNPRELKIIFISPCTETWNESYYIEKEIHKELARFHLGREWFNCTLDKAIATINIVTKRDYRK